MPEFYGYGPQLDSTARKMHYVTTGNIVAIATAFAAFLTAVSGIVFSWLRIRREVQKWVRERKVEFMNERLKVLKQERFSTYPLVMKTLGAVRDVPGPNREHYAALESDPNSLVTVSDELIAHLYGPAGLVMSMGTRTQLLAAWEACQRFQRGSLRVEKLVNAFYQARRKLREDIQIYDAEKPLTEKDVDNALQQPF